MSQSSNPFVTTMFTTPTLTQEQEEAFLDQMEAELKEAYIFSLVSNGIVLEMAEEMWIVFGEKLDSFTRED